MCPKNANLERIHFEIVPTERTTRHIRQGGVVLAMVLVIIAGMSFIAFETMRLARVDLTGAAVIRTQVVGQGLLQAGLSLAKQVLREDSTKWDSLQDTWAYFPERCERLSLYFTSGVLAGSIEDEQGRFPVNVLPSHSRYTGGPHQVLSNLIEVLIMAQGLSGTAEALVEEIANWIGPTHGKSDNKYLALPVPMQVPHAPMRSLDEILHLQWPGSRQGDIEKLYHGTDDVPGLKDLLTVHTNGPLNLNTADKLLLYAVMPNENKADRVKFANRALQFRNNPKNALMWRWFDYIAKDMDFKEQPFFENSYGFASQTFRVNLTAQIGAGRKHAIFIVSRKNGQQKVVRALY